MIVNRYDIQASFKFLSDLSKKLGSDTSKHLDRNSAKRLSSEELETIVDIVQFQEPFCLYSYSFIHNLDGFAIYNTNDRTSVKENRPLLRFIETNLPSPMYLEKLQDIANDTHNIVKLSCLNLKPKSNYTQSGMPKYHHGMKLMDLI